MGSASSTLKVLDFATDFIPGVNLIKNTTIAIYDAATGGKYLSYKFLFMKTHI